MSTDDFVHQPSADDMARAQRTADTHLEPVFVYWIAGGDCWHTTTHWEMIPEATRDEVVTVVPVGLKVTGPLATLATGETVEVIRRGCPTGPDAECENEHPVTVHYVVNGHRHSFLPSCIAAALITTEEPPT
jgi:hypothetical protein